MGVLAAEPVLSLEAVIVELLDSLRRATTLVDVNVAAGIAHEAMRAF